MDENQRRSLYQSIAISTGITTNGTTPITPQQRNEAFVNLEQFKKYEKRVVACVELLQNEHHILSQLAGHPAADITIPTKLYALDVLHSYVKKFYSKINESERLALRWGVLTAAKQLAVSSDNLTPEAVHMGAGEGARILGMKVAAVIADFAVRDFPQRWNSFVTDVFVPQEQGGIWGGSAEQQLMIGIKMGLECLKIITENCTDSDFNAKVSAARRNEVLIGLNEVSSHILPLVYNLLSEQYSIVSTGKNTIQEMEAYLISNGRNTSQMTSDERTMYDKERKKVDNASKVVVASLITLQKFCHSMPLEWMFGNKFGLDFIAVYLHLLRESTGTIQIETVACLEALALRKLEFEPWYRLLSSLPQSVAEANKIAQQEIERRGGNFLVEEFSFHRSLSRMLALLISSHVAHITTEKEIVQGKGPKNRALRAYLSLLCEMLGHPSGRVCGEQINTWYTLLRDPQITTSSDVLTAHLPTVLQTYITHLARIRWEDVEDMVHPMAEIMETSWDDKDDYDTWLTNQRSRGSLLFRFIGNCEPEIAVTILNTNFQNIIAKYSNGEPRDHLDPETNCLTVKSEAIMQFESIQQPMNNILKGLPSWAVQNDYPLSNPAKVKARTAIRAALSQMTNSILSWNPTEPYLRLERADFISTLKFYWNHDSSTLPAGVKILVEYLCAKDDWKGNAMDSVNISGETIALRKRAGICLVSISKHIPHLLVPWLAELSTQATKLLATNELISMSRMHLYEFLSCVATAVEDPVARANFIGDVLRSSFDVLESNDVKETLSSMEGFMMTMGISQASTNPSSVTDENNVKQITDRYARFFSALNQLLSVGKRCHQAARKRPNCGLPIQNIHEIVDTSDVITEQNFPDEGPISINELAFNDPFVPLWPRLLPILLRILDMTLRLWHPEYQAVLLANPIQRFVFAISDDEVYLSKKQEKGNNGVFGKGGTAGSVVRGWDRRKNNLAPRWSGWFNELRNTSFQLLGLLADQRVLFAPEISGMFPQLIAVVSDATHIRSMEHRHFSQYMKQFIENVMVSCPSTLYQTHLAPIIIPVLDHIQYRLGRTWEPILGANSSISTSALSTTECEAAAALALKGGEEWYSRYYARTGIFSGDVDSNTGDEIVEKNRVEITRIFCDVIQTSLALRGEWALVLANKAKEEQAIRKNDPTKLTVGPRSSLNDGGKPVNADGTPRNVNQLALEKRQFLRIHKLCQFLLLENEAVAGALVLNILQCLNYPDAYTCRRCTRICHRILETTSSEASYTNLLGYRLFAIIVKSIVTEPKWMVGIEWEMIALLRDVYCRLVLGQFLQPGGQGPGLQQPRSSNKSNVFEQAKNVGNPLQGGGILCTPSDLPRQILAELPGVGIESIKQLEALLTEKRAAKDQKDALRELLRAAAEELKQSEDLSSAIQGGILGRALAEESVLNQKTLSDAVIPDLPEKLVTNSQMVKKMNDQQKVSGLDTLGNGGLSNVFG